MFSPNAFDFDDSTAIIDVSFVVHPSSTTSPERHAMNPMDSKIGHALKEIETVYAGKEASHAYFDHKNKVYVLVVSGEEAEAYHNAVRAIHDLALNARRLGRANALQNP